MAPSRSPLTRRRTAHRIAPPPASPTPGEPPLGQAIHDEFRVRPPRRCFPADGPSTEEPGSAPSANPEPVADQEPVAPEDYRSVMRHWPSGVTVITTRDGERDHGMTASAFTSVSLSPPMVLIVVDRRWRSHDLIESGGVFCVNILAEDQVRWSDRFAGRHGEMPDRFVDVATTRAATGCACLAQATAWLDCRIAQTHRAETTRSSSATCSRQA